MLLRVQPPSFLKKHLGALRIDRIRDAAVVDRTDRRTLRLIEVPDTFGAPIMGDDVDAVSYALAIADMISLRLCVTPCFKDRFVRTLWKTGTTGDTFFGDQ